MNAGAATSNTAYGPDVPVGTPAYTGVEFYYITFDLPADATNVSLAFPRFAADDRLEFQLNGQHIGYWGGSTNGAIGQMVGLGSQPSVTNVVFNANFANPPNLTDQSLFNIGGQNVMRFWVNNTGSTSAAAGITPHSGGNPSVLDIRGTLSFERATTALVAVPEPSTLLALGLALAAAGAGRRRMR
jgi:hypothetical protein